MHYVKTNIHLCSYLLGNLQNEKIFRKKKYCRENRNKPSIFNNSAENSTVCEIMWKNVVETYRPQMTLSYDACALHAG